MRDLEAEIEEDLKWREAELASMKALISQSATISVRHSSLLRAALAMLYAHYEGFSKFCWELYVDEIVQTSPQARFLKSGIRSFLLSKQLKKARNLADSEFIEFLDRYESIRRTAVSEIPDIDTRSNLWPEQFSAINENLALSCDYISEYNAEIKALVGRRNEIAHGKKLIVKNIDDYTKLEQCTLVVMHELALATLDGINKKEYIKDIYR